VVDILIRWIEDSGGGIYHPVEYQHVSWHDSHYRRPLMLILCAAAIVACAFGRHHFFGSSVPVTSITLQGGCVTVDPLWRINGG
jgi:hypothetical protein